MKKILLIALAFVTLFSCKEDDYPYPGYLIVDPLFADAGGGTVEVPIDTDRSNITLSISDEYAGWCSYTVSGNVVNLQLAANTGEARSAVVGVRGGDIDRKLTIYQWGQQGDNKLRLINDDWSATCSDEQTNDGGGVYSIFDDDQSSKFWHSAWSPSAPLPHWILVDMKQTLPVSELYLGWRNNSRHTDTRAFIISVSTDGREYKEVADVNRGPSPDSGGDPAHTIVSFAEEDARYIRMDIYESNRDPNCNLGAFIPYAVKQ